MQTTSTNWLAACVAVLLVATSAQAGSLATTGPQPHSNALPDSIRVYTTPSMLAEHPENPESAYLAVGLADESSGHDIYVHLDLGAVVEGLSPSDWLEVNLDLTSLHGVASDPNQLVAGEHALIEVDHQGANAVLRDPDYEETSFCHIPTHDEFAGEALDSASGGAARGETGGKHEPYDSAYEAAGEELIHALVSLTYTVNGGGGGSAEVVASLGVYDPELYAGDEAEASPTCVDDAEPLQGSSLERTQRATDDGADGATTLASESAWCLSWFSAQCERLADKEGDMYCPYQSCNISWARLLGLVTGPLELSPPAALIASGSIKMLSEWLETQGYVVATTGRCNDVYLLGFIWVGCQCVFHVF